MIIKSGGMMLKFYLCLLLILSISVALSSQNKTTIQQDLLTAQMGAIERAIQYEDYLFFKKLNKDYFDEKKIDVIDRKNIIIESLFGKLKISTKKNNIINLNKRLNLEIIKFLENSVLIKAKIFGFENCCIERNISYKVNSINRIVFSFEDIVSSINNLREKL